MTGTKTSSRTAILADLVVVAAKTDPEPKKGYAGHERCSSIERRHGGLPEGQAASIDGPARAGHDRAFFRSVPRARERTCSARRAGGFMMIRCRSYSRSRLRVCDWLRRPRGASLRAFARLLQGRAPRSASRSPQVPEHAGSSSSEMKTREAPARDASSSTRSSPSTSAGDPARRGVRRSRKFVGDRYSGARGGSTPALQLLRRLRLHAGVSGQRARSWTRACTSTYAGTNEIMKVIVAKQRPPATTTIARATSRCIRPTSPSRRRLRKRRANLPNKDVKGYELDLSDRKASRRAGTVNSGDGVPARRGGRAEVAGGGWVRAAILLFILVAVSIGVYWWKGR